MAFTPNNTKIQRVVIKVGTAVVSASDGGLALGRLGALVEMISVLHRRAMQVILVSSGAVGLGKSRLGRELVDVVDQQVAAAIGQSRLMGMYDLLFDRCGITTAQVLLTGDDFGVRKRYLALAATLERLLTLGVVPVLNENDVVGTEELIHGDVFGDNDGLAALVAVNVDCDALFLLSDIDAVYTKPPGEPGSRRIAVDAGQQIVAGETKGRGGISSKILSARTAATAGLHVFIASGLKPEVVCNILDGDHSAGTYFPAREGLSRKRRWLAFSTVPQGTLTINEGAAHALVSKNASLLAPGIVSITGEFEAGSVVIVMYEGAQIARGVCGFSSAEVRRKLGSSERGKAIVHRDALAITKVHRG